ncbi:MAG TPA: SdrD B-like domain-containing protein, partial [Amycolatopsis sp.]|nr:SdrD B-like domain-containing protein [Amycolatopsis sp.]
GADGRFTIANVPAQRYGISVHNLPGGWVFDGDSSTMNADVDGSTTPQALLRAVRPLSEQLHATGSFDKRDYQPGDPVQVKFTLTNVGSTALQDLTIGCDRFGSDDHILGWQSWPDLQKFSLAPGETRTFTETGTVPQVSPKFGGFYAACDFGPERGPIDGYPNVNILARVPGPSVPTKGSVFHDDNNNSTQDPGEGIANRFVTLNDVIDGHHIATGRTDADGHVSFASIPAGRYVVRVAGGWVSATPDMFITVGTCGFSCSGDWTLIYKRG